MKLAISNLTMQRKKTTVKKGMLCLVFMAVMLCYMGCGGTSKSADNQMVTEKSEPSMYGEEANMQDAESSETAPNAAVNMQKLIKTGNISLEVEDVREAFDKIDKMARKFNGYIFDMNEYEDGSEKEINLTVKVDNRNFEAMMKGLESIGKVHRSGISTQDVTREYIDTEARISTLKIQEETLKELLKKAEDIEDLLRIETELQNVRQKIESAQGQLNYLKDAVSYSTVDIVLRNKILPTQSEGESSIEKFVFSLKDGFGFWGNVLLNLIATIIWLSPVLLIGGAVFFLFRKPFKGWKEKRAEKRKEKRDQKL